MSEEIAGANCQAAEEKSNDAGSNKQSEGRRMKDKTVRDFSNTDRDSSFFEKLECAMTEFEHLCEEIRNRLGVEPKVKGKIGIVEEWVNPHKQKEVKKDQRLEL